MDWPADKVERRAVAALAPYAKNARTHSDEQVSQIAASIEEWGWTVPVLIDPDGGIIAGHGRVLAAQSLCIEDVPVMVAAGWSDAQKQAYILADNKLAENAGWDMKMLAGELSDLSAAGFDVSRIGFSAEELAGMSATAEGLTDPDEVPEPPDDPITQPGDAWILGAHRLVCGDCTDAEVVAKCLNGVEPHLMVTDPPYGVEYDPAWRAQPGKLGPNSAGSKRNNGASVGVVMNDGRADWREAWALFPGDVAYVWHGGLHAGVVESSLINCGLVVRAQIIWVKSRLAISRGDYHWQHEACWYAVRKGKTGHYCGGRKQTTVWEIDKPMKSETGHSTQKPVECMKRPIENNSSPGQAVYEPFSGSGTTIIAGEMTGRAVYAIEINPAYVDMAVERWQNFTGKKAVRETHGSQGAQAQTDPPETRKRQSRKAKTKPERAPA